MATRKKRTRPSNRYNSTSSTRARAIRAGYRSGLEEAVAKELNDLKVSYGYETIKIGYIKPVSSHTYTPDFVLLDNGIIIETKGRFTSEDRKKHLLIKQQSPHLDIRFVFSRSATKMSKKSKTTYASWCEKHGFKYADKSIPEEWIEERKSVALSTNNARCTAQERKHK